MKIENQIVYENNIMIAKFMGGEIDENGIIVKEPTHAGFACEGYNAFGFLLYDDSWEWLMPVIEKIELLHPDNSIIIYNNFAQINGDEFIGETKLDAAYKAVVYFLTSYYSQTN